jgi:hypothetical protein
MIKLTAWVVRHGRNLTIAAAGLGALLAAFSPGLSIAERIAAPCAVVLMTAIVYGFVFALLSGLAKISLIVLKLYGYIFLVAGLSFILTFPLFLAEDSAELGLSSFEHAMQIGGSISMGIAASWAAAIVLVREHVLPNTSLERTRGR